MRTIFARAVAIAFAVLGAFVGSQTIAATPAAPTVALVTDINLTSYANGAWMLKKPAEYDESWSAFWLLDERAQTGWATPKGTVTPQELLIVLPE